ELVLLEDEIRDDGSLRARTQIERVQLLKTADQKSELSLKRCPRFSFVKRTQEGIFFGLHDPLRVQAFSQNAGQGAFSDSDRAFDCNVAGTFEEVGHGLEWNASHCRISRAAQGSNCGKS